MTFDALGIPDRKAQQFIRAGIQDVDALVRYWPKKYNDRSSTTGVRNKDQESVFIMHVTSVKIHHYTKTVVQATGTITDTGELIRATWFNQDYLYWSIKDYEGCDVLVCGKVSYCDGDGRYPAYYQVLAPQIFTPDIESGLRIHPVYKKIKGMSDEYLINCINEAIGYTRCFDENIPPRLVDEYGLMSRDQTIRELHRPTTGASLEAAVRRKNWEDLLYFALRIELDRRHMAVGSPFNLPSLRLMRAVQKSLPFQLTEDQASAIDECVADIRSGRRLNALIQGDVGCGKTIVAVLLMTAVAENGLQAVLMAPTQLLAKQHYEYLKSLLEPYGLAVAFVSGKKLKAKEQAALEKGLATGTIQIIVGTQALLSKNYQFKNLALIIEDEEHKYGVLQRKKLADKAAQGTHTVKMSATPIPRTLAQIIYGENLKLFCIHTKPSGRKPIATGIAKSEPDVFRFIDYEVNKKHHQVYVVCPMIASNTKMEGVASAEEVFEKYTKVLGERGIKTALVTGKTKKTEAEEILGQFARNEISVLVSTTVIEVGINVPNASTIVIQNAERFGLAQLHQLRGRVGRGDAAGVCVLVSEERENERLKALCDYTDGFKIAEMDLQQRGAGELIGCQQSGSEYYLSLALLFPKEYRTAQKAAADLLDSDEECSIRDRAYEDFIRFGEEAEDE
jgi:ATP-dependent DNA helicase RecG